MSKQLAIVILGIMLTATGMAALYSDRMTTRTFCHDPNFGQEGALAAAVQMGGLKSHTALHIYTRVVGSPTPMLLNGTYDVQARRLIGKKGEVVDDYTQGILSLQISRHLKDKKTGKYSGELRTTKKGKTVLTHVICSDQ